MPRPLIGGSLREARCASPIRCLMNAAGYTPRLRDAVVDQAAGMSRRTFSDLRLCSVSRRDRLGVRPRVAARPDEPAIPVAERVTGTPDRPRRTAAPAIARGGFPANGPEMVVDFA
jgi:hypothetical protein